MDISNHLQQVTVVTDQDGLVATSEKLTITKVAAIVPLSVKRSSLILALMDFLFHLFYTHFNFSAISYALIIHQFFDKIFIWIIERRLRILSYSQFWRFHQFP